MASVGHTINKHRFVRGVQSTCLLGLTLSKHLVSMIEYHCFNSPSCRGMDGMSRQVGGGLFTHGLYEARLVRWLSGLDLLDTS